MSKISSAVKVALIITCIALSAVSYFVLNDPTIALLAALCGVVVWVLLDRDLLKSVKVRGKIDSKELKEFRKSHPDLSMSESISAYQKMESYD